MIRSWWGVSVLTSAHDAEVTAFAVQIAYATSKVDGRVLWLSLSGEVERPVFYLLTALSGVPYRSLFIERTLGSAEWSALASAREDIESLPVMVADCHGMSASGVRLVCAEAACGMPLDLVIVDGVRPGDVRALESLEVLSEELGVPVLVLAPSDADATLGDSEGWTASLRQGSFVFQVKTEGTTGDRSSPHVVSGFVAVNRVGLAHLASVPIAFDRSCRRFSGLG
ncbi:MAG: DnaB-like helicase C-terminal domain-containing protein [Anaeromyxobacteraceae bacterium]